MRLRENIRIRPLILLLCMKHEPAPLIFLMDNYFRYHQFPIKREVIIWISIACRANMAIHDLTYKKWLINWNNLESSREETISFKVPLSNSAAISVLMNVKFIQSLYDRKLNFIFSNYNYRYFTLKQKNLNFFPIDVKTSFVVKNSYHRKTLLRFYKFV